MKLFYIKRHINTNKCLNKSLRITKIISCFLVCSTLSVFAANNASAASKSDLSVKATIGFSVNDKTSNTLSVEQQQTIKISGVVVDSKGQSVPGATVRIKGANTGTTTDANGKFSITVPSEQARLQFSFVGYVSQDVVVGKQRSLNIILKDDLTTLDEVVVVGFGTQKKVNLTGSVSTVNAKTLEARPVTNVGQALQGVVPGLNITQSGQLGGSLENRPSINIRGVTTIGGATSGGPLILIDGMEGDINAVNPDDIENISVLKDAAASSIYGSRAPFGVILVTTKKGKAGKTQVNYTSSLRSSSPIGLPHLMDSYTFAQFFNDANKNSGNGDFFSPARMQRIKDFQSGKITTSIIPNSGNPQYWADGYGEGNDNVDWFKAVYKSSAPSQEHGLSVNGGNENITYYLSGNYLNQEGLMKLTSDNYERYTTTAKINAKISEWASLSYTGRFTREDYVRPSALTNSLNSDLARQGWPMLPLYDPNGYLYSAPSPALALRDGGRDKRQDDWTYQQLKLTLEPIKGWKIFADLNYKVEDYFRHWDTEKTYNHDVNGVAYLYGTSSSVHEEASRTNYFSPNIYSEYAKSLGDHNLKLMVGYQSELNKYRSLYGERQGVIVPSSPVLDITSGTDNSGKIVSPGVGGQYKDWSTSGYFGRLNYDYKGRYMVEANLRYDGTSRFRSTKQWKYFPSASLGWNVAQEEFWKPIESIVNQFKLRASYGQLGNQNTLDASGNPWYYPTYVTMPFGTANSSWLVGGIKTNTSSAPGLISSSQKWETISTYNFGTDMGFLKNRLTTTFDYFIRYTNDMIGPAPELPAILGTAVPTTNNTDLKTYGFELAITWQDRLKNGLGYSAKLMLSDSQTKITNYPNPAGNLSTYYSGEQYGEIWGYTTIGIAKTQAEMDKHLATLANGGQNALGSNWKAGDLMFKDLNGDGKIDGGSNTTGNHGDLSVIGNSTPRYSFALDLSADWKGFDIRAFFQGILKRDYFQNSYYFWGASGSGIWWSTGLKEQTDYFRDDPTHPLGLNLDSYYPRPLFNGKNQQTQTRYIQNAAYIRLKNLQIGYTIPSNITKKIRVNKFRVYISGENIWTKTKLSTIFDPETIDGGWGGNVYPLSKVYSVGVSVNF
ncbi:MAG: TonB-dependent receptor [Bacteroidetes bacterium]|nr:TonB-dependent receptor [Bacteroidota bacterium]